MRPRIVSLADAPTDGVNEVQTLEITGDPEGGDFTISFDGQTTAAIAWNATAAVVQTRLQALSNVGSGGVTVAGGPMPALVTITFGGNLSGLAVAEITTTLTGLTGGSPVADINTTVAGVRGSFRGVFKGTVLYDTVNGDLKVNSGTTARPVWTDLTVT